MQQCAIPNLTLLTIHHLNPDPNTRLFVVRNILCKYRPTLRILPKSVGGSRCAPEATRVPSIARHSTGKLWMMIPRALTMLCIRNVVRGIDGMRVDLDSPQRMKARPHNHSPCQPVSYLHDAGPRKATVRGCLLDKHRSSRNWTPPICRFCCQSPP